MTQLTHSTARSSGERLVVACCLQTMLVEKIAAEARVTLLVVSPSAVLSKWCGAHRPIAAPIMVPACMPACNLIQDPRYCMCGAHSQTLLHADKPRHTARTSMQNLRAL